MIEIRFHGRGGQGAVTAARLLAEAAFLDGKDVQSFPFFGVERRGAPVTAFARINTKKIRIKTHIYEPDYVVVLDSTLLHTVNVSEGLKKEGIILINSDKKPENIGLKEASIATVDATRIALKYGLGSRVAPIVNTAVLGAFARATGVVKIGSVVRAIKNKVPSKREANIRAAQEAYNQVFQ